MKLTKPSPREISLHTSGKKLVTFTLFSALLYKELQADAVGAIEAAFVYAAFGVLVIISFIAPYDYYFRLDKRKIPLFFRIIAVFSLFLNVFLIATQMNDNLSAAQCGILILLSYPNIFLLLGWIRNGQ